MPNQSDELDLVFLALGDPTRRAVLERLSRGQAPVSELAQSFNMALPSFLQHLRVLEERGLVQSSKSGRVRTYELVPARLKAAEQWMQQQRNIWERRLDQLDSYLLTMKANAAAAAISKAPISANDTTTTNDNIRPPSDRSEA